MPTVSNASLILTTVNLNTEISVSFDTTFTAFERSLATQGMTFHPHVVVKGMDPAGGTTGTNLSLPSEFPRTNFAVTAGAGPLTIPRTLAITVPRSTLQEDTAAGDNDEIRCGIEIHSVGLPLPFTTEVLTPQQILVG